MQRWLREVTMGLVRKTLSVATLGAVSFRGKKEKLRRAERALRDAEQDLARERSARETAERRIGAAEERVKQATAEASHAAKRLEKVERKPISLSALPLGDLKLRDVRITTGDRIRLEASFGA